MNKFDETIAEGLAEIEKGDKISHDKARQLLDTLMQITLDKTSKILQGISSAEIPFIGAALIMMVDSLKSRTNVKEAIDSLYDVYSDQFRSVTIEIPRIENEQKRSGQDE